MKKGGDNYNFVNLTVAIVTTGIFISTYGNVKLIFQNRDIRHIFILLAAVCTMHLIKAARLYLVLYGTGIELSVYIKMYCKITPVSMVFPFKTGEFFRMFCYGRQINNLLKGAVIILLDRFMDTIALVTMIFLVWIFNGGNITLFTYLLLLFLAFALLIYFVFPGVHSFWKKYILKAKATEKKLAMLKILNSLDLVYQEIRNVSKGRGMILYFMSLLAWAMEIGGLAVVNEISGEGEISQTISAYLLSAMGTNGSIELRQFVFLSVILLMIIYLIMKGLEILQGRKTCR